MEYSTFFYNYAKSVSQMGTMYFRSQNTILSRSQDLKITQGFPISFRYMASDIQHDLPQKEGRGVKGEYSNRKIHRKLEVVFISPRRDIKKENDLTN